MPIPVTALVLVLITFMSASTSVQTPTPRDPKASESRANEHQANERRANELQESNGASRGDKNGIGTRTASPRKKPPDGLLPVVELTRLSYTPSERPQALLYGTHLLIVGSSGFVEGRDAATGTSRP